MLHISNIGTFPDFFPQASLYASTYHAMSIEINFAFHNLIKFRLGINRIFLLEYANHIAVQLLQITNDILQIPFVFAVYIGAKYIANLCYYSFCHKIINYI